MKGNKKLLVIAALLLLISASFTTYAIYRDSITATGTIKAANWVVKVNGTDISEATVTITGADLTCGGGNTRYGKNNTVAPGDSCTATFTIDATGSEVDVVVEAEVDTQSADYHVPTGVTVVPSHSETNGIIAYDENSMTDTVTLTITWAGSVGDSSTKDGTDKAFAGDDLSIPVKVVVRQDAPASA